ncbi:hypothetical protein [Roseospira navarrensis]|uniref:Uncharacterized protein n=1 Tax=Roseospira navarrensis TaxID=140058 RepID=A0A7X1ZBE5_9PROT|nr:hypothetical protein [Roseospira navarrensis]MQX35268.1 hypothetical protein [Roseospira navarrensis]
MSDTSGAGGPSGSSGVLSSTMRSITRQAGDPQDREVRRVEDVVDLSPGAAQREQSERPVEPADAGDQAHNPGSQKNMMLERLKADEKLEAAEQAAREAEQAREAQRSPDGDDAVTLEQPVNIGMAAAINIGARDMVRRFDTNGDSHLDYVERNQALEAVQSNERVVPGGGRMSQRQAEVQQAFAGEGEVFLAEQEARRVQSERQWAQAQAERGGEGQAFLAEQQAREAKTAQRVAELDEKAERSRAERLAALEAERAQLGQGGGAELTGEAGAARPAAGPDSAYRRSEDLALRPTTVSKVKA